MQKSILCAKIAISKKKKLFSKFSFKYINKAFIFILSSYRPIAQLPVVAKVMKRHVANQLQRYMEENDTHVLHQSVYRVNHSTETALLKIYNHISRAKSSRRKIILVLLHLSVAFDTLNHDILISYIRQHIDLVPLILDCLCFCLPDVFGANFLYYINI